MPRSADDRLSYNAFRALKGKGRIFCPSAPLMGENQDVEAAAAAANGATQRRDEQNRRAKRNRIRRVQDSFANAPRVVAKSLFDDKDSSKSLYKDKVFTLEDWRVAKSWHRHLPRVEGIKIAAGFCWIVIYCFLVSFCICCYHFFMEPLGAPGWADQDSNVWQVFNLTSFALALLLVFRTNSSYGRWWEARILWGGQINMTRDIVRRAISHFPAEAEDLLLMFARWSAAMSFALKACLRDESALPDLQVLLPDRELIWAAQSGHVPTTVAQVLSEILSSVELPDFTRMAIDEGLNRYLDILGSCERLLKTPIHRNWTSHTSSFVVIWMTFLPFPLWPIYGWATPGITVVVAWLLLGIENIGVQIEEPFAVLALDAYCDVCNRSVQDMMAQRKGAKKLITRTRIAGALLKANSLDGCVTPLTGSNSIARTSNSSSQAGSSSSVVKMTKPLPLSIGG